MIRKLADYIEAGRAFDADEREIAALALQHVDEAEHAGIDASWDEEVDRRVTEILDGMVQLVSGEETLAMGRAMLAARRRRWSEHPVARQEFIDALAWHDDQEPTSFARTRWSSSPTRTSAAAPDTGGGG